MNVNHPETVINAVELRTPARDDLATSKGILLAALICILLWALPILLPFGVHEPLLAIGVISWAAAFGGAVAAMSGKHIRRARRLPSTYMHAIDTDDAQR